MQFANLHNPQSRASNNTIVTLYVLTARGSRRRTQRILHLRDRLRKSLKVSTHWARFQRVKDMRRQVLSA